MRLRAHVLGKCLVQYFLTGNASILGLRFRHRALLQPETMATVLTGGHLCEMVGLLELGWAKSSQLEREAETL